MNKRKLSEIAAGKSCVIDSYNDDEIKLKLMEMGCLPGEVITVERIAPLGDPMALSVAGYTLSIRKNEAATVTVTEIL